MVLLYTLPILVLISLCHLRNGRKVSSRLLQIWVEFIEDKGNTSSFFTLSKGHLKSCFKWHFRASHVQNQAWNLFQWPCLCFMSWLWEWVVLYTLPILILISEPILLMMWLVFSYVIFIDWIWIFCAVTYGDPKNIVNFVYCSKLWDLRNSTGIRVWRIWEIVTYSFRRSHSWILHKCKPYRWIT